MKENVYYTQDMLDEAADMVDRYAKKNGFDRKSPKWKKIYNQYLNETLESLRPALSNPQVSKRVITAAYEDFYDPKYSFIAKKLGDTPHAKELMKRLESAVNNINSIYLEVEMGMKTKGESHTSGKTSSFDMPENATEAEKSETWYNQYKRMTSLSLIYASLYPMLVLTTRNDILAIMGATNLKDLPPEKLHDPDNRVNYSKTLVEHLKPFFYQMVNFKKIFLGEAEALKRRTPEKQK